MTGGETTAPSVSQRAATGAGWIIAWRVATRNIGLLSTLILVRLLQPADFGLVALATGFISSVDALSAIGVQDALVRAPNLDRDLYDTGFGLSVLRGALTAALIALIAWPVGIFFSDDRLAVVMLALAAGTLISAFENIGIVDFRRDLAFRKEFDMQLTSRIIGATTTIVVAVVWRSYWALVAGILVFRAVRLIQSYLISPYRPRFALRAWRRIIGFSLWTWAGTIVYQIRDRSDSVIIGRLIGPAQFGLFSVGSELGALPVTELVEPLGRVMFSGFASLHNGAQSLANMFLGAVGMGFMITLPAGIGISMIADPMVRLTLGEHWLGAVPVVEILAVGATFAVFAQVCGELLNAVGRPHVTLCISSISTVLKIGGLLVLVPLTGLQGAASALVLAGIFDLVQLLRLTLPLIGASLLQLLASIVRPVLATGAMVACLWFLDMAWTSSHGVTIFDLVVDAGLRSAAGAICYVIILTGAWFVAGRPAGAERFALSMIASSWRRVLRSL
jgi:O-antigen/teichoic acid export membrane protein